jgi:hypothetical protein
VLRSRHRETLRKRPNVRAGAVAKFHFGNGAGGYAFMERKVSFKHWATGARNPNRFQRARDRGAKWLVGQQRPDGGIDAYYKALSAFQVCGLSGAAGRLCDWIYAHEITANGDFGRRPVEAKGERYAYVNAWIVAGAHRFGRFDLSQKGMDFLLTFRDQQSGGFYSSRTRRDADTEQDLMVVGFCGLAAIHTGRQETALGVGQWLKELLAAQPAFPERLYTVFSRAQGLHTAPSGNELRYVVESAATRDQLFFQPGIAGAFLVLLFEATGEQRWLELARDYMRFAECASDYLFRLLRAGKVGWAASLLYRHTRDPRYHDMAMRIGDNLIMAQTRRGCWNALSAPTPSVDITAEMIVWLDAIGQVA